MHRRARVRDFITTLEDRHPKAATKSLRHTTGYCDNRRICAWTSWLMVRLCHDVSMSKRSRRLGKKIELRAVEEAIGASLGKNPAQVAAESRGKGGKVRRKEVDRDASKARPR